MARLSSTPCIIMPKKPVGSWLILGHRFEIYLDPKVPFDQPMRPGYAVLYVDHADGPVWLDIPERSYETEAGANYAILSNLEDL